MPCPQSKLLLAATVACCLLLAASAAGAGQQQVDCAARGHSRLFASVSDKTTHFPLPGAMITARWPAGAERQTTARTDSTGRGVLCIPTGQVVTVRSSYRGANAPPQTLSTTTANSSVNSVIDMPGSFVRGRVIDQQTGNAVTRGIVRIGGTRIHTLTDTTGRFYFERVPIGEYHLRVEHIAYAVNDIRLQVGSDDLDALVPLTPIAIPLQPIVVTAFSRRLETVGFYDRRKRGVGTFIDRKQIDAMNAQDASDLLRRVPNLRLIPQARRNSGQPRNATVGRRAHCRFAFVVDGARTLPDFEMDFLAAPAVEGIEVYNGLAEVPAYFKAHASSANDYSVCGVIAIWTRNSR